ncbi:TonB-dependent receptor domain-containing protein [Chitinophaga sp. GCM10012297]|uniref:TonB-dependent receptor n=1 Tax=Chitinophaga chungangae TaxID=2821488 RepID=A0ABS3Y9J4_9BACT|nr:TonB-dependent receptor [Chitinophaga chungangae]MBO9151347.1 TonB-dependent receptor [Chitinophaga chungangae]
MNFRLFIAIFFLGVSQAAFGQKAAVTGAVVDKKDGQPLEYASVAVFKTADSSLVAGAVTDAKGAFTLEKLKPGNYHLRVLFMGYEAGYVSGINLTEGQRLSLGKVSLSRGSALLNQVNVTGERADVSSRIDKQTFRAGQFESAKGGNAIDVLKNLPSVSMDGQGGITVRGSSGFLVLINGKPVITDAQTVLSQLPANAVENIELITSPSAKYDPDGKGGIINIITKKGATDGLAVSANIMAGLPSTTDHGNKENPKRFGGDLTVNFKKNKWDVSISGNYTRNDNAGYREGDVYTKNFTSGIITRFPSNGERSFDKYNYAGRASATFTPDSNNTFSAGFFIGKRYQARLADILYNNTASDLNTGELISSTIYFNSNLQTKEGNFSLGNLDYTRRFRNQSTLTASALFESARLYGNTCNRNLGYPDMTKVLQEVRNPYENPIDGYRFKLDYSVNIGKGKLESGYQFRHDRQNGKFDYFVDPATSQPDAERFRGSAKTRNQVNSVYTQYSGRQQKLEYVAGLRYEYAARTVELSYDPEPHKLDLSNLFPSVNLLYNINEKWKTKAGYSKRIQRTNNFELNPIPEREHSETLEQGDPDLLPSFIDLAEAGPVYNFKNGSVFVTAYYQHIKNPIQRVNSVYADTILNRVFTNAEAARTFGLEAGTNLQPAKWWSLYLGGNVYNYRIKGNLEILGVSSTVNNKNWVYSLNMNTSFKLGTTWSLQANVNYLSARPTAQGEDSRFLVPNTSLKRTFMDGRMAATLQWQNMDLGMKQTQRQRITTSGRDFYTTTNYIYETDVFLLNLSFNLNKPGGKSRLPNSEFGDKEF